MAKKIMQPSMGNNGAFVSIGDPVEFEVPYGTKTMMVTAVEINVKTGMAVIHGKTDKGNEWIVPAKNLVTVFNSKLPLKEKI